MVPWLLPNWAPTRTMELNIELVSSIIFVHLHNFAFLLFHRQHYVCFLYGNKITMYDHNDTPPRVLLPSLPPWTKILTFMIRTRCPQRPSFPLSLPNPLPSMWNYPLPTPPFTNLIYPSIDFFAPPPLLATRTFSTPIAFIRGLPSPLSSSSSLGVYLSVFCPPPYAFMHNLFKVCTMSTFSGIETHHIRVGHFILLPYLWNLKFLNFEISIIATFPFIP